MKFLFLKMNMLIVGRDWQREQSSYSSPFVIKKKRWRDSV